MKKILSYLLLTFFLAGMSFLSEVNAQEDSSKVLSVGVDFVSQYVWRGFDIGSAPSIQPCIELNKSGFTFGTWGAYATNFGGYKELDLYAGYTFKDMLTLTVCDYYVPSDSGDYRYLDFGDISGHTIEASLKFTGPEKFPISLSANIFFFNDDDHSLYFEASYPITDFEFFIGAGNGFYSLNKDLGIVNVGVKGSKEFKISENFSLTLFSTIITNPDAKKVFFVAGISL